MHHSLHWLVGSPSLICDPAITQLVASNGSSKKVICPCFCQLTNDLQSHMGAHILCSQRGIAEALVIPVGDHMPCGFCGLSDRAECAVMLNLKETANKWEFRTECLHQVSFRFGFADKGSESRPCHNVPVICTLCVHHGCETDFKPAIWRYNMEQHLNFVQSNYTHPGKLLGDLLPSHMLYPIVLTPVEEKKLGVLVRQHSLSL